MLFNKTEGFRRLLLWKIQTSIIIEYGERRIYIKYALGLVVGTATLKAGSYYLTNTKNITKHTPKIPEITIPLSENISPSTSKKIN